MARDGLRVIKSIVDGGLGSLRNCLYEGLESYWPQEGKQNGLPERNLSLHVGHMFLQKGWNAFTEASYPGRTDRRIDLMAFRDGTLVACECKQLDMADRAAQLAKDAMDIKNFKLTTFWNDSEWQAPKIKVRYGVLLAVTWNPRVKTWWVRKEDHHRLPDGCSGKNWRALGQQLNNIDGAAEVIYGDHWLNRSDEDEPDFWALYSIFRLPQ